VGLGASLVVIGLTVVAGPVGAKAPITTCSSSLFIAAAGSGAKPGGTAGGAGTGTRGGFYGGTGSGSNGTAGVNGAAGLGGKVGSDGSASFPNEN
jgi:hypothetical protein